MAGQASSLHAARPSAFPSSAGLWRWRHGHDHRDWQLALKMHAEHAGRAWGLSLPAPVAHGMGAVCCGALVLAPRAAALAARSVLRAWRRDAEEQAVDEEAETAAMEGADEVRTKPCHAMPPCRTKHPARHALASWL